MAHSPFKLPLSLSSIMYIQLKNMKFSILILVVAGILSTQMLTAQDTIKIKYEETFYMTPSADMPPQMASQMPKSRKHRKILLSTEEKALYIVNKEDVVPDEEDGSHRGRWAMKRQGVDPIVFLDFDAEQKTTFTDLFGKEFLIEEGLPSTKWKLHSGEQRDILGYTCIKATQQKDSITITAWFTPKLAVPVGPDGYHGLPGAILAVSEGDDKVILATAVVSPFAGPSPIEKPTKGEKTSREKFDQIRKEKMEEMRQMNGGQGQRVFIRG